MVLGPKSYLNLLLAACALGCSTQAYAGSRFLECVRTDVQRKLLPEIERTSWGFGQTIQVSKDPTGQYRIDGIPAKREAPFGGRVLSLEEIQRRHEEANKAGVPVEMGPRLSYDGPNKGWENDGIYFFMRDGEARVIKVLKAETSRGEATSALHGYRIGETQGGPKVFRHGTIKEADGSMKYYVEMESLFPGQSFVSFKEIQELPKGAAWFAKTGPDGRTVFDQMIGLWVRAAGARLCNVDADFAISDRGEVRWLDTQTFRVQKDSENKPYSPTEDLAIQLSHTMERLGWNHSELLKPFFDSLIREFSESQAMSTEDKTEVLNGMFPDRQSKGNKNILRRLRVLGDPETDPRTPFQAVRDRLGREGALRSATQASWNQGTVSIALRDRDGDLVLEGKYRGRWIAPLSGGNHGLQNHGVFFYNRDGQRRVIKVLHEDLKPGRPQLIRALQGGLLGQVFGAPRTFRHGMIRLPEGKELPYIEMEEVLPGQNPFSFKETMLTTFPQGRRAFFDSVRANSGVERRMIRKIIEAWEYDVIPNDPDFMLTREGEVRWVDANRWYRDHQPLERMAASMEEFLSTMERGMDNERDYSALPKVVDGFFAELRSSSLPESSKLEILLKIFPSDDRLLLYGRSLSRLRRAKLAGLKERITPYDAALRAYRGDPR